MVFLSILIIIILFLIIMLILSNDNNDNNNEYFLNKTMKCNKLLYSIGERVLVQDGEKWKTGIVEKKNPVIINNKTGNKEKFCGVLIKFNNGDTKLFKNKFIH